MQAAEDPGRKHKIKTRDSIPSLIHLEWRTAQDENRLNDNKKRIAKACLKQRYILRDTRLLSDITEDLLFKRA
jgi:hypothetical protein